MYSTNSQRHPEIARIVGCICVNHLVCNLNDLSLYLGSSLHFVPFKRWLEKLGKVRMHLLILAVDKC